MLEKSCAMQAEKEVSLSSQGPIEEGRESNQNSNPNIASSASIAVPQFPAKKPTRQWAAWTHQEEESFFTALRQVGKNFAKITSRVQSKNKDQVRHYYYRLVRRMNKLLGPELSLDAKNPKDTNAAMLRWWSLLEKYSCKASKLHLKPRRFKLFLEALEHQLLKDRRKSSRKRACHGESFSSASLGNISSHSRERGLDNSPFKLILCDSQNVRPGRASTKHGESLGVRLGDEKEDTALGRAGRQRRKQAGYRKWEKAAIDGVSLVADAAEHLERTSIDKDVNGQKDLGPTRYLTGKSPLSLPSSGEAPLSDANMQFSAKLKLQLFPIDESTRRSLEADKHNPHLELTLSNRKKISSVLEHLNRKWGSSSCACGELMLFPYNARKETVALHQRWTNDSFLSAVEVYSMVGSPSLFRLRYGWFVQDASGSFISQVPTSLEDNMNVDAANEDNMLLTESGPLSNKHPTSEPATSVVCDAAEARDNYEPASATITPFDHLSSVNTLSAGAWADSLTNISIGDLLSVLGSGMKKWILIAATVAIIAVIARQGTGWSKEAALEALKEWSDRLGIWAIPTYVAVHTVTLALCLPHAVFFEAGASILFGFLPALLCVFSAKVLAASFSFWIGRFVFKSSSKATAWAHNNKYFNILSRGVERDGWKFVLLARFSPIPSYVINYALAATQVRFLADFLFPTLIGCLPMILQNASVGSLAGMAVASVAGKPKTQAWGYVFPLLGLLSSVLITMRVKKYSAGITEASSDTSPSPNSSTLASSETVNPAY